MADEFKTGNEVTFKDGRGPKSKSTPAEFPSDWHYEAHQEALERDYLGLVHRLDELRAMPAAHPRDIEAAEEAVKAAKANLPKKGQASASKRPKRSAEKR